MDFLKWAEEYSQTAEQIKQMLDSLKQKRKSLSGEDAFRLERKIASLHGMYDDCISTSEILKGKVKKHEKVKL